MVNFLSEIIDLVYHNDSIHREYTNEGEFMGYHTCSVALIPFHPIPLVIKIYEFQLGCMAVL